MQHTIEFLKAKKGHDVLISLPLKENEYAKLFVLENVIQVLLERQEEHDEIDILVSTSDKPIRISLTLADEIIKAPNYVVEIFKELYKNKQVNFVAFQILHQ